MKYLLYTIFLCIYSTVQAQFQIPVSDSSAYFDGQDDYFDLGNTSSLNFENSDTFAISLWIKIPAISSGIDEIITKAGGPGLKGWGLQLRNRELEFFAVSDFTNQNWYFIRAPGALTADQWHHVVFNYAGATNANANSFIIDGIEAQNLQVLTNTINGTFQNSGTAQIGHYDGNGQQAGPEWFVGNMDELIVWDTLLDENFVRHQMHLEYDLIPDEVISYWKFNSIKGDTLIDLGGSNQGIQNGGILLEASFAPVGIGKSDQWLENMGQINIDSLELMLDYSIQNSSEIFAAKIISQTDFQNLNLLDSHLFVVHRDGSGAVQLDVTFQNIDSLNTVDEADPCRIQLYKRALGGGIWTQAAVAQSVNSTQQNVRFSLNDFEGQFVLIRDFCSGIELNSNQHRNKVYPNPVSNEIKIGGMNNLKQVKIYDSAFKLIHTSFSSTISVDHFECGIYHILVLGDNSQELHHIIKE